jgi:hypothetical protein
MSNTFWPAVTHFVLPVTLFGPTVTHFVLPQNQGFGDFGKNRPQEKRISTNSGNTSNTSNTFLQNTEVYRRNCQIYIYYLSIILYPFSLLQKSVTGVTCVTGGLFYSFGGQKCR